MTVPPGPPPRPRRRAMAGDHLPERPVSAPLPVEKPPEKPAPRPSRKPAPKVKREVAQRPRPTLDRPLTSFPPASPRGAKVDLRDHRKERRAARRRLIALRVLTVALIAVAVGGLVWLTFFSALFKLDQDAVTVEGAPPDVVSADVMPAIAARVDTPLPRVSTAAVAAEIGQSSQVMDVRVARSWPRGLHIEIVERKPAAIVEPEQGQGQVVVGIDGVVITPTLPSDELRATLPLVHTSALEEDHQERQAAEAVLVWDSLPETISSQVESIAVNGRLVTLSLTDGSKVVWGDDEESELKAQVVELLMEQHPAQNYDVRDPRRPVTS